MRTTTAQRTTLRGKWHAAKAQRLGPMLVADLADAVRLLVETINETCECNGCRCVCANPDLIARLKAFLREPTPCICGSGANPECEAHDEPTPESEAKP